MLDLEKIQRTLGVDWARTQELIRQSVSSDINLLQQTNDGILAHGGKMLRPLLSLLSARLVGASEGSEEACICAAASELLHNATLLHDDVADGSPLRRGMPTTASVLGPTASVLLGDFWLVKAMKLVLGLKTERERIADIFADTLMNLAEGEMLQLDRAQDCNTTEEDYMRIIYCKTASLFEASCLSSALVCGASPSQSAAVKEYSRLLGLSFQVRDDILDYVGGTALGKPCGEDLDERKITMPLLGALGNVSEERRQQIRKAVMMAPEDPAQKALVVGFVKENGGVEYAQERLVGISREAVSALDIFPDSEVKGQLVSIAGYMSDRNI